MSADGYIVTASGNVISKKTLSFGMENINIGGSSLLDDGCVVRGDLAEIEIGVHCIIGKNVVIRPPSKTYKGSIVFFPLKMGDFVHIEEGCVVQCFSIGSNVYIGRGAVIGPQSILSECCYIEPNTVIPAHMTVAPYAIYGGNPGRMIGRLPEGWAEQHQFNVKNYIRRYTEPRSQEET